MQAAPTVETLFLTHSIGKLRLMTQSLETWLPRIPDAEIWSKPGPSQNSIGNLILHLCGNVRQWIGHSVGGLPDIRHRETEFNEIAQLPREALLALLQTTVADTIKILTALDPARLTETVQTQDGPRSVLEVIYQVVGHFQQHTGQVIFAAKRTQNSL